MEFGISRLNRILDYILGRRLSSYIAEGEIPEDSTFFDFYIGSFSAREGGVEKIKFELVKNYREISRVSKERLEGFNDLYKKLLNIPLDEENTYI